MQGDRCRVQSGKDFRARTRQVIQDRRDRSSDRRRSDDLLFRRELPRDFLRRVLLRRDFLRRVLRRDFLRRDFLRRVLRRDFLIKNLQA